MKLIELTQGKFTQVDDDDFEWLNQFKWHYDGQRACRIDRNGNPKNIKMHRLIMGVTDPKIKVDHRDGNPLNNQRNNLRLCTNQQNSCNKRKQINNTSGYKGVDWNKSHNKWRVSIKVKRISIFIGYFNDKHEAGKAYNEAAIKYHGEFAKLNVIEGT